MNKDAYYFPHDSNAQHDEKILKLRGKHGWAGYGLYWAIIERLRDNSDYCLDLDTIPGLAVSLNQNEKELQSFVNDCCTIGLLQKNKSSFHSPSLSRRMEEVDKKRDIWREAGRRGGLASSLARATLKPPLEPPLEPPSSSKEKKRKENKSIYTSSPDGSSVSTGVPPKGGKHLPRQTFCNINLFEELWKRYPNKDGKKAALRHFINSVKTEQNEKDIEKALDNYLKSDKVKNNYIKNGSTWFNNWEDWIDPPEAPHKKTSIWDKKR